MSWLRQISFFRLLRLKFVATNPKKGEKMRRFLATMFVALTVCCGTVDPQPPSPFGDQNGECPNGIKADGTCFQLTTDDGGEQADAGADAGRDVDDEEKNDGAEECPAPPAPYGEGEICVASSHCTLVQNGDCSWNCKNPNAFDNFPTEWLSDACGLAE